MTPNQREAAILVDPLLVVCAAFADKASFFQRFDYIASLCHVFM